MDENALREMLERATREEPPMGRLSVNALREGIRIRRRRRAQSAATAAVAAVAVIGIVPALTMHGTIAARAAGTAYVAASDEVVPVNLATDAAGHAIRVAPTASLAPMAIAPNGRTVWVTSATGLITPIDTATNKAGRPINLHSGSLTGITITPNSKAAFVIAATGVIQVNLVTGQARGLIRTPYAQSVEVAPNGKFAYVLGQQDVIPIRVANSAEVKPIPVSWDSGLIFSPNGKTAYALSMHDKQRLGELIPINTTTNAVGRPIYLGAQASAAVAIPHSPLAYVRTDKGPIVPVNLVTRTVGKPVQVNAFPTALAVAPNGLAVYVFTIQVVGDGSAYRLTEISTVRNTTVRNIGISDLTAYPFTITPDGRTGFVATAEGYNPGTWQLVTIHLANNKAGRRIQFGHQRPVQIVFTG
jgi:hypothetical protein